MDEIQGELKEVRRNIQMYDKRLGELHPQWCEYWRVKKRKEKAEQKLKRYSL